MNTPNLDEKLRQALPDEITGLLFSAGEIAAGRGESLYLVGGAVRDLLLGEPGSDLDLVVEGDGIALAQAIADVRPAAIVFHHRFGTAKLRGQGWTLDLARARRESYDRPGALPTIEPGSLQDDLFRRDFTVNALALALNPGRRGELIDHYGGQADLTARQLRVLHPQSFVDDATRIWRGLRYEQRLGFTLEETTRELLERDIPQLGTISGDRIRYELECVFHETYPEKVIARAAEVGALQRVHPSLGGNDGLKKKSDALRRETAPRPPSVSQYLALLSYNLGEMEYNRLADFLHLSKPVSRIIHDTITAKSRLRKLATPTVKPSYTYQLLHDLSPTALTVAAAATSSQLALQNLNHYRNNYRYVKPDLGGSDLISLGVTPGPQVKTILDQLLAAKLDGKATTRPGQEMLVRVLLESSYKTTSE